MVKKLHAVLSKILYYSDLIETKFKMVAEIRTISGILVVGWRDGLLYCPVGARLVPGMVLNIIVIHRKTNTFNQHRYEARSNGPRFGLEFRNEWCTIETRRGTRCSAHFVSIQYNTFLA